MLGHDPVSGQLLLFGGVGDAPDAKTWTWTGLDWKVAGHDIGPIGLSGASLGFDAQTQTLRLIGGQLSPMGVPSGSTSWRWDGSRWLSSAPGPTAPAFGANAELPSRAGLAVFGGFVNGALSDQGWLQSSGSRSVLGVARPGARAYASMVYEPHANGLLLFGGQDATGLLNESWLWSP